jgi:hypothetical protein
MKLCTTPMSSMAESMPAKILLQSPRPLVTPSAATCRWLYPRACSLDQQRYGGADGASPLLSQSDCAKNSQESFHRKKTFKNGGAEGRMEATDTLLSGVVARRWWTQAAADGGLRSAVWRRIGGAAEG